MAWHALFLAAAVAAAGRGGAPAPGGTIRVNAFQPPKSQNAYVDNSSYTHMSFSLMYETLIDVDRETGEFSPCLAESWEVSPDAKTFTFHLDPAARWSDGRPVTSDDVRWTFDAITAPDALTGPSKAALRDFEPPETPDPTTVVFRVTHNARHWRDLLHAGMFEIMPRHAFDGRDFNALDLKGAPVSGPYSLVRVDEQVESEFRRRSDWWRAGRRETAGTCLFDRILFRYFADDMNAYEAFLLGKLDVYAVYSARIWATERKGTKYDRNYIRSLRVRNRRPLGFQGFAMNMRRPPFDDIAVRRAMSMLIDRETMNRTLMYGEYFMHRSYFEDLYDSSVPCTNPVWPYDPKRAAAELDEAGWKLDPAMGLRKRGDRLLSFVFLSRSAAEDKFLAPFSAALASVGAQMKIVRKDFTGWMRDMDEFNFDMTWASWGASIFRDPESQWHSREAARRGGNNICGFADAEVDRLIDEEEGEFDVERRNAIYRKIDAIIAKQVPYVLLWNTDATRLLFWNKFSFGAEPLGKFGSETVIPTLWSYSRDRAEELAEAMASGSWLPAVE